MRYLVAVGLLILFAIAAAVSGPFAILCVPFDPKRAGNIVHAQDVLLAAMIGMSGDKTVSKECAERKCRFCATVCNFLSRWLEPDHCQKQTR